MSRLIAIPAADRGWQLQSSDGIQLTGETVADVIGRRSDVIVGIPSARLSTFLVSLPPTDANLHESMIRAQIEKRGLLTAGAEELFDFELIESSEEGNSFAVVVAGELSPEEMAECADGYASAAELVERPRGGARVWKEWGRLVFGVFDRERLIHLQVLSSSSEVDEGAARELSLLLLSLESDSVFGKVKPTELEVAVAGTSPEQIEIWQSILSIPVREEGWPVAILAKPEGRGRLLPSVVTRARRSRRNRLRGLAIGSAVLLVYLVVVGWLWVSGKNATREIDSLERQISIVQPDVERIQQVEQRWKRLEPSFEKSWFPVVQLSRITSALPGSGVVVREYRTSGRTVRIRGQARDVQLANRLLEDLQAMDAFAKYDWKMPNPKVERNNTASFEIEGRPKDAETDG